MRFCRASMIAPTRGSATFDIITKRKTKQMASQNSCEAKVSPLNGGKGSLCPAGCSVCAVVVAICGKPAA